MIKPFITFAGNKPINMNMVTTLSRRQNHDPASGTEKFYIVFNTLNSKAPLWWIFNTEKERNIIYEKILRFYSINLIADDNFFAESTITKIDDIT